MGDEYPPFYCAPGRAQLNMDKNQLPRHVAIIMDGNGRWAKARGMSRAQGHMEGVKRVEEIIKAARDRGIEFLTIYAFSTENWNRPKEEIDMLMRHLEDYLKNNLEDLKNKNIRLNVIGRRDRLPAYLIKEIERSVEQTKNNSGFVLNLALDYGARCEMLSAVKAIIKEASTDKSFDIEKIDEKYFSDHLYTKALPDPDLLIRTSGEERISNFMLWQLSYAELYFPEVCWPDFKKKNLEEAIEVFNKRKRRFGRIE